MWNSAKLTLNVSQKTLGQLSSPLSPLILPIMSYLPSLVRRSRRKGDWSHWESWMKWLKHSHSHLLLCWIVQPLQFLVAECRPSLQVVALEFGCITSEAVDGVGTQSFREPSEVERQVTNFTCSSCPTNEETLSLGSFSAVDAVCLHGFFKEAMISTTELRLSIQNFTLKLWLKTAKILAKMPSKCSWGFMSRDRSFQFPHRHTELSWQLLKGILYRFPDTLRKSPWSPASQVKKKIERSNHLKTTLTHHKILPDSALRQICGCVEKMACRIHKADYLEKGEHRGKRLGQIKWLPSGVGIACHPTSQMCQ